MEPNKTTLGLELPTDPRWVDIAEKNIEDILVDHAFCEQKAASTCISLIITFPECERLVETLTPIVAEEWAHFELVLAHLKKRGFGLGKKRKDEYVVRLHSLMKTGGSREEQMIERLLVSALIEARSCERFKLLWKNLKDEELQRFYYDLMVSEAGHYHCFIELAKELQDEEKVEIRWREFLKAEAEIMKELTPRADRIH
jgi:tRNA 2-(methylsulfanyl)-N6-isopentenyladenosine37 hydroxylase